MQIILHPTLPSKVIQGPRVQPGVDKLQEQSQVQQVLVAIVKASYEADEPEPKPLTQQLPIYDQDIPFNWVRNADFATGEQRDGNGKLITPVTAWCSKGPTISQQKDDADQHYLRVEDAGRVVQLISFGRPLGGRTFMFSFCAKGDLPVMVSGIQVESSSGKVLFAGSRTFNADFSNYASSATTWPAELKDTEAKVVLVGAASTEILYDQVQLTEGTKSYPFDADDPIRYEHDLAIYKSRMDVVVLGAPNPPYPGPQNGRWSEEVICDSERMRREFGPSDSESKPFTFGWQPRSGVRLSYAGDAEHFDPETMRLPKAFNNLFFNGGEYSNENQPAFSHAKPGDTIQINAKGHYQTGPFVVLKTKTRTLHLPSAGPRATISYRTGPEPNTLATSEELPMVIDTVVFDKATNHFTVVWRGVWELANQPTDRYVSLVLS